MALIVKQIPKFVLNNDDTNVDVKSTERTACIFPAIFCCVSYIMTLYIGPEIEINIDRIDQIQNRMMSHSDRSCVQETD